MTDALRDSVAKRIAGWDSDYRAMDQGLSGTPRIGPPAGGRPRENFREISGPGRARRGAPRGPDFGPSGTPKMDQKWAFFGPFLA